MMLYIFSHLPDGIGHWRFAGTLNTRSFYPSDAEPKADSFSYETSYRRTQHAFPIDPISLGFSSTPPAETYPLSPTGGLLAFGAIRDAAPDAWGRRIIEARFKAGLNDLPEFTYLLAAGGDRIGALDIRYSSDTPYVASACSIDVLPTLLEVKSLVEEDGAIPSEYNSLLPSMSGAGGARPKALVRDNVNGQWIAKFASCNDTHDLVSAEYGAMMLARACGMNVPVVQRVFIGQQPVLLVRRFDRYWRNRDEKIDITNLHEALPKQGAHEYRIPFISALTLLGCAEFESPSMSYSQMAAAIRGYVHTSQVEKDCKELFKRMVFNILINNDDDHLRNHGFVYDYRIQGWRLAPLYDVVPRPSFSYERRLHLKIGTNGKVATLENALSCCTDFVKDKETAIELIRHLWQQVNQWKLLWRNYGVSEKLIGDVETAFRPLEDMAGDELCRLLMKKDD